MLLVAVVGTWLCTSLAREARVALWQRDRLAPALDPDTTPDGPAMNASSNSAKLYFVVSGRLRVTFDDGSGQTIGAQGAVHVPPGVWVELWGEDARILIICSPAYDPADETIEERKGP